VNRVAVLAAHPDDELLGAGATLAKYVLAGDEVHAVVLADGATSRYEDATVEVVAKASKRAVEALGLASARIRGLPDQRLDHLPLVELTQVIETVLDELCPDVVDSHVPADVNHDHRMAAQAVWTAWRPYMLSELRRFAMFAVSSSTGWAWRSEGAPLHPYTFNEVKFTVYTHMRADRWSSRVLAGRARFWSSRIWCLSTMPLQLLWEVC